ncbi:hypothetical protein NKH18_48275 [Streptomyces sp. M10(2022)]
MKYARRIAAKAHRFPDTKRALIELLERWGAGLTVDRTERRMAVRLSQDRRHLIGEGDPEAEAIAELPPCAAWQRSAHRTRHQAKGRHQSCR